MKVATPHFLLPCDLEPHFEHDCDFKLKTCVFLSRPVERKNKPCDEVLGAAQFTERTMHAPMSKLS